MKNKQTIEDLKAFSELLVRGSKEFGKNFGEHHYTVEFAFRPVFLDEIQEAIMALEQQNEEETILVKTFPEDLRLCKQCGSTFVKNQYGVVMNYCPNCGKKIKREGNI